MLWNGSPRTTTFVNVNQLTANIPASEKIVIDASGNSDYTNSELSYALYNKAAKKPDRPETGRTQTLSEADRLSQHVYTLPEKEALLSKYAASLALVRKSFAFDYQSPPRRTWAEPKSYLADDRQLARALALDAQVREAHGDYAGAANCSLDAMELGTQISHGSDLLGGQVGFADSWARGVDKSAHVAAAREVDLPGGLALLVQEEDHGGRDQLWR